MTYNSINWFFDKESSGCSLLIYTLIFLGRCKLATTKLFNNHLLIPSKKTFLDSAFDFAQSSFLIN